MRRLIFIFAFLVVSHIVCFAQYHERREVLFDCTSDYPVLQPGGSFAADITPVTRECPARATLLVRGRVLSPEPFEVRGEEMLRRQEYGILDNLDSEVRWKDEKSLYFKGNDDYYDRRVWNRIPAADLPAGECTLSIPVVRSEGLGVSDGGSFGVTLDMYFRKEGRAALDVYDEPDSSIFVPIPEGSLRRRTVERNVSLPGNLACVLISAGGSRFCGECWLEAPSFKVGRKTVWHERFCDKTEKTDDTNYWVGMNLCDRFFPLWTITLNGDTVFSGNVFDDCSPVADFYIPLPEKALDGGRVGLVLGSEPHRAAYPYEIHSVDLIWETARPFEVISVPKFVREGDEFGILVETNVENVTLRLDAAESVSPGSQTVTFADKGLHVLRCKALRPSPDVQLRISDGNRTENASIRQILNRTGRRVEMSVGDNIYVSLEDGRELTRYLKWYTSSRAGTMVQFRPSFQWSGNRMVDRDNLKATIDVLNDMRMPYAWMVEGRTLAGWDINPAASELASPMFAGKQAHENDGGYYYWTHFDYYGLFCDMAARNRPYGGIFAKRPPIYTDHGTYIHYDRQRVRDMADGARYFVDNLRYSKGESIRHTGPSVMFRYFYQAGYDWLGSEMMYAPDDILMCSLRGASRAYSKPVFGSLHAMQWSYDYNDLPRSPLRLFMSHAVAYMHGSSHLNTEDALYQTERDQDRFSEAGIRHLESQNLMMDYVQTHDRRGDLHTGIAIIQGRDDPWNFFGMSSIWNQDGDKWKCGDMISSYDLFSLYYPWEISPGDAQGGWNEFSYSPYGAVDFVPVEAPADVLGKYRLAVFLGWNTYSKADFERLRDFVFNGGTLIMTAAHANSCLQPDMEPVFPDDDSPLREMLGDGYRKLTGKNVIPFGAGKTIFYAQKVYPSSDSIREDYLAEMKAQSDLAVASEPESGWIDAMEGVDFAIWQDGGLRTAYVIDADWYNHQPKQFGLMFGNRTFELTVKPFELKTIRMSDGLAVCAGSNTSDVLDISRSSDGWTVTVQATGPDSISVYFKDSGQMREIAVSSAGIHKIKIIS